MLAWLPSPSAPLPRGGAPFCHTHPADQRPHPFLPRASFRSALELEFSPFSAGDPSCWGRLWSVGHPSRVVTLLMATAAVRTIARLMAA